MVPLCTVVIAHNESPFLLSYPKITSKLSSRLLGGFTLCWKILNCRVKMINNGVHENHWILEMCFFEWRRGIQSGHSSNFFWDTVLTCDLSYQWSLKRRLEICTSQLFYLYINTGSDIYTYSYIVQKHIHTNIHTQNTPTQRSGITGNVRITVFMTT